MIQKKYDSYTQALFDKSVGTENSPVIYFEIPSNNLEISVNLTKPIVAKYGLVKFISAAGGRCLQAEFIGFSGTKKEKVQGPINKLLKDTLIDIFGYLTPMDLIRINGVSKFWAELGSLNQTWEKIFLRQQRIVPEDATSSLKQWYIENTFKGEVNTWTINRKSKIKSKLSLRVLMLGLDMAGKTLLMYKLKLNDTVTTIPTIGFNVETIKYQKSDFTIWDVGGQDKIRPLWRHYYQNTQAVIFVVDAADPERLEDARNELKLIADDEDIIKYQPVLLLVLTKTDLLEGNTDVLHPRAWADKLGLIKLGKSFPKIYVHSVSAFKQSAEELKVLLDWIAYHGKRS